MINNSDTAVNILPRKAAGCYFLSQKIPELRFRGQFVKSGLNTFFAMGFNFAEQSCLVGRAFYS